MNIEKLLNIMEDNANLSNKELAVLMGEKEEDIASAICKLENDGIIKSYKTVINWEKTQIPKAKALIEVCVTPERDTGFDDIAGRIMEFSEVEAVYLMAGGYDLAVIVSGESMADVAMFVRKRLAALGGILSTATRFLLTKYKDQGINMYDEYESIDERGGNLCD